jgi:hypothetical protein
VEQPATSNVKAVSATVLSGSVANTRGLTSAGHGDITLTVTSANDPATVLLDYGVEVEGAPYLDVQSYSGPSPSVSLAFTEARTYLRTPGSSTPGAIIGDSAFQARSASLTVSADGVAVDGSRDARVVQDIPDVFGAGHRQKVQVQLLVVAVLHGAVQGPSAPIVDSAMMSVRSSTSLTLLTGKSHL